MKVSKWDGMLTFSGRACSMITEGAWCHPMLSIYDAGLNAPRLWYSILVRRMLIGEQGVKVYMIYTSDCCYLCYIWMLLTLCAFIAR